MHDHDHATQDEPTRDETPRRRGAPGKATLTSRLPPGRRGEPATGVPSAAAPHPAGDDPFGLHLLGAPGQPLDAATRGLAERGLGCDLGRARVHTGPDAAQSAAAHGAEAYALGDDVVFGDGRYQPDTDDGRWLLMHELAHVVQQDGHVGAPMRHALAGGSSDATEDAADTAADRILAGETGIGASLARGPLAVSRFEKRLGRSSISPTVLMYGLIHGPDRTAAIAHEHGDAITVPAGQPGALRLELEGRLEGVMGTVGVKGPFSVRQRVPYHFGPDGQLVIKPGTAAVTDDGFTTTVGFGPTPKVIAELSTDGASSITETIQIAQTAGSVDLKYAGAETKLGGDVTSKQLQVHVDVRADGAGPRAPAAAPSCISTTQNATTVSARAAVPIPPPHSVYFELEGATTADTDALVRWAANLPAPAQKALRDRRLRVVVLGYASTTSTPDHNFEKVSRGRAEWIRQVMGPATASSASLELGWRGSATAPPPHQVPGGVPARSERRVDITFEEVGDAAPTVTHSTSSTSVCVGR